MNLVIPEVEEVVLVTDGRKATVYIRQGPFLPNATVVFDSPALARQYIRSLGLIVNYPRMGGYFTERDLVNNVEKRMRL